MKLSKNVNLDEFNVYQKLNDKQKNKILFYILLYPIIG